MPSEFLTQQMELRESLEEAAAKKDSPRLDLLRKDLGKSRLSLQQQIAEAIDAKKDYRGAADLVRKLQFLDKLDDEIDAAYETIE
jgi:molecular chaperone HscB